MNVLVEWHFKLNCCLFVVVYIVQWSSVFLFVDVRKPRRKMRVVILHQAAQSPRLIHFSKMLPVCRHWSFRNLHNANYHKYVLTHFWCDICIVYCAVWNVYYFFHHCREWCLSACWSLSFQLRVPNIMKFSCSFQASQTGLCKLTNLMLINLKTKTIWLFKFC